MTQELNLRGANAGFGGGEFQVVLFKPTKELCQIVRRARPGYSHDTLRHPSTYGIKVIHRSHETVHVETLLGLRRHLVV